MDQRKLTAGVFGAIILIISLVLYAPMVKAADVLYREFVPHCTVGNTTSLNATGNGASGDGFRVAIVADGTACQTGAATGATTTNAPVGTIPLYNESGSALGSITVTTGGEVTSLGLTGSTWLTPSGTLSTFGSINKLLLSLLPLLLVTAFIATAGMSLYQYAMTTSGGLQGAIKGELLALVLGLLALYVAPTVLSFLEVAASVTDGGLTVTSSFGNLIDLVLGLVPTIYVVGIIGVITWRGRGLMSSREGGEMGMGLGK